MTTASPYLTLFLGRHASTASGMWVYSRSLLEALTEQDLPGKIHCVAGGSAQVENELRDLKFQYDEKVSYSLLPRPSLSRRGGLFGDLLRPCEGSVVHATSNFIPFPGSGKRVLTLHDLIQAYPHNGVFSPYRFLRSQFYRSYFSSIVSRLDLLLTDIPSTKIEIEEKLSPRCRVEVVYPGLDISYLQGDGVGGGSGDLLAFASRDDRKNIQRVLQAFAQVRDLDGILKVLATSPEVVEKVSQLVEEQGLSHRVTIISNVPQSEMPTLYRSVSLVVFPSMAEGFGYPIYEALSQGVSCVHSEGLLIPEIEGRAEQFCFACDPLSVGSIQEAIRRGLGAERSVSERENVQADVRQLLSFKNTAGRLCRLYKSL